MVDHLARTTNDAGQRPDTSFLTLALEALLRLTELYAAERDIRPRPGQVYHAERIDGVVRPNPARSADAPTVASSASAMLAEPPEEAASTGPDRAAEERGATAATSRHGGWTRGNSTSAQIRAGAVEYLRQKRARAHGREICEALLAGGMVINTKNPVTLVSCRIGRSPLFDHTYEGYGLVEWSSGTERSSGEA